MPIIVSALSIYPVKSFAGISLDTSRLALTGLNFDRGWMVVSPTGRFMTQRTHPQMAMVDTRIDDGRLVLDSFGLDSHIVPDNLKQMARLPTEVWGDAVQALDVGDETAAWLGQALGEDCRMVVFPTNEIRPCKGDQVREQDHTQFADGYPLLIVSDASLEDLNGRLAEPVEMKRFRPNLVVSGADAFAEDNWKAISIGDITIRMLDRCARCSVPTVDPGTGILRGPEPIHTLNSYRQKDGEVFFAVNAAPDREGKISVGDEVTILS